MEIPPLNSLNDSISRGRGFVPDQHFISSGFVILPEREIIPDRYLIPELIPGPVPDPQILTIGINDTIIGLNISLLRDYNLTTAQPISYKSILCGFPSFCSYSAYAQCLNTTLRECNQCNMSNAGLFVFACVVLGLLIILGNVLVLVYSIKNSNDDHFNKIKASLAAADLLTGIQIFCVALYNVSWTLNSTSQEIDARQLSYRDSPEAIAGGIFYMFGITSSLYHLLYLSGQRLFAVTYPINYKTQSNATLMLGLALSWIFAALSATVPAWFPRTFVYTYYHTVYLFYPSIRDYSSTSTDLAAPYATLFIFTVLPFLLMTVLTITSAVYIRNYLIRSAKMSMKTDKHSLKKKEAAAIKTIGIMQLGFTVTLVPVVVVVILFYTRYFQCKDVSTPYTIGFYMSTANSFVNVLVYTVRDAKFRSWLKDCLRCHRKQEHDSATFSVQAKKSKPTCETDSSVHAVKSMSQV
uniref:G-protein coupled receptors family 1 profile domain-containing protein n=1 Tax=Ciona savignyi TaxID=51511 RepID=H2Z054_CIOSA